VENVGLYELLFVDVGANVGCYTILACRRWQSGVVFDPGAYNRHVENLRLTMNHLDERGRSINKGVAAREGTICFSSDEDGMIHVLAPRSTEESRNCRSHIVGCRAERGYSGLIKIDVEMYETPVLERSQEMLRKPTLDALIMELNVKWLPGLR
jgi:FkbM family methyltransferase